tara:strand:+ start:1762 stop:1989 length:228 start_codon:yes stop_codon:yes gene_type:complete
MAKTAIREDDEATRQISQHFATAQKAQFHMRQAQTELYMARDELLRKLVNHGWVDCISIKDASVRRKLRHLQDDF